MHKAKMQQLQSCLRMSSSRQVHQALAIERLAGAPILSSTRGLYFLPDRDEAVARQELEAYRRTLRARALNTLRLVTPIDKVLRAMPNQTGPMQDSSGVVG